MHSDNGIVKHLDAVGVQAANRRSRASPYKEI